MIFHDFHVHPWEESASHPLPHQEGVPQVVRSTLLWLPLIAAPKGEIGGVSVICGRDTFDRDFHYQKMVRSTLLPVTRGRQIAQDPILLSEFPAPFWHMISLAQVHQIKVCGCLSPWFSTLFSVVTTSCLYLHGNSWQPGPLFKKCAKSRKIDVRKINQWSFRWCPGVIIVALECF